MAAAVPKLTYFDIEAAAEKVRLAFVVTGQEFQDNRFQFSEWSALKPSTPYGQVPIMEIPGMAKPLTQSGAMVRYVCSKYGKSVPGLYPVSDDEKMLAIEEMIGLVEDFQAAWKPALYIGMRHQAFGYPDDWDKDTKETTIKMMREKFVSQDLPKFLGFFIDAIKKNGGGFLNGPDISVADLYFLPQLRYFTKGVASHVPTTCLEPYPEIVAYMQRCYEVPQIKKWYGM